MGIFRVRPDKEKVLLNRMLRAGIEEKDIQEKFIRSRGKGGQKVNKTSSCVWLRHIPSGIEVKVDRERSQGLNRFLARRLLVEQYEKQVLRLKTRRDVKREQKRKQKKRRNRRAQKKYGRISETESY